MKRKHVWIMFLLVTILPSCTSTCQTCANVSMPRAVVTPCEEIHEIPMFNLDNAIEVLSTALIDLMGQYNKCAAKLDKQLEAFDDTI